MTQSVLTLFKKAYLREVEVANLDSPLETDPRVLESMADEAWKARSWPGYLGPSRALWAVGHRSPRRAARIGKALLSLGRFEEALDILSGEPVPPGEEVEWGCQIARAALACGLKARAEAAIGLARGHASDAAQLQAVEEIAALVRGPPGPVRVSWPETRSWTAKCLEADQPVQACAAFVEGLSGLAPDALASDAEEICETARAVLLMGDGSAAIAVLLALEGLFDLFGEGEALRRTLAALRGRPMPGASPGPRSGDPRMALILKSCLAQAFAAAGSWPDAIERFETPVSATGQLAANAGELARCIGRRITSGFPLAFAEPGPPRVFDMFPFNGEFLMLEMKLAQMGPWVEKFILVEAAETFSGNPKPRYYEENKDRFAAHADRIVHVRLDRFPEYLTSPWAREFFQRDYGLLGLQGLCAGSDLVIISDVDEIIREEAVRGVTAPVTGAELRVFNYFLNLEVLPNGMKMKTVFARARLFASMGPSWLRMAPINFRSRVTAPDAGWHFSAVGSASELARKFASYSHVEWAHLDEAVLTEKIRRVRAKDLPDRFTRRELDDSFPEFILEQRERLKDLLL
jgi:beta-1,4-mannosyl-glycoprotein beta-1,4-N-acetylglucosaminyltransferase